MSRQERASDEVFHLLGRSVLQERDWYSPTRAGAERRLQSQLASSSPRKEASVSSMPPATSSARRLRCAAGEVDRTTLLLSEQEDGGAESYQQQPGQTTTGGGKELKLAVLQMGSRTLPGRHR
jgi:hypothetical protein